MFQNVQKKLTALYVLTAGIILTAALGITAVFFCQTLMQQQEKLLLSNISTLLSRLQTSNRISDSWLEELEVQNQLVLRIEEKDLPLLHPGGYLPATDRETLFACADRIIASRFQKDALTGTSYQSPVFRITGSHHDSYLCAYMTLSVFDTYLEITVFNDLGPMLRHLYRRLACLLILEAVSLTALFWLGRAFVKRAMAPIRENEKRQQEFISAASHELRTPITLIRSAADSLLDFPDQISCFQKMIQKECSRMTSLIRDLLALTSPDSFPEDPIGYDPATLVLELYETYQPLCRSKSLPLLLELPEDFPPPCQGSPSAVTQILRIFLDNAVSYSPAERSIVLRLSCRKNKVCFQVIDHGPGIPDARKEQVFQRFYRSDSSRSDREHFGLGLSIAQVYAARIHGKILLEDTPGGGASFSLVLPAVLPLSVPDHKDQKQARGQ